MDSNPISDTGKLSIWARTLTFQMKFFCLLRAAVSYCCANASQRETLSSWHGVVIPLGAFSHGATGVGGGGVPNPNHQGQRTTN